MPGTETKAVSNARTETSIRARLWRQKPSLFDCLISLFSAGLLIVSFPNFEAWPLAWAALVPLLVVVAWRPQVLRAFLLGWLFGSVFFYGSCYWLTYSMIHTGHIAPWIAYLLLAPGAVLLGLFPAVFFATMARLIKTSGAIAIFFAPLIWAATEWSRLAVTGQLWNAIGYSQAYHPHLIQSARWGGVYAVGFLVVGVNAAITYAVVRRTTRAILFSGLMLLAVFALVVISAPSDGLNPAKSNLNPDLVVVAVQPNVPVDPISDASAIETLMSRHLSLSSEALARSNQTMPAQQGNAVPRLVVWPESPMNFTYGTDIQLRDRLAKFAQANRTSILLNSQEIAPDDGLYNSALLINEDGKLVAQYDKIRLLPFGEYVPLPRWAPGAGLIRAIVGDFVPGTNYRLMPIGNLRAGVFICIESAYPSIARNFAQEGAVVLINISNDGYLGPTPVMRQHLANAIFRAVENRRPVLRVTNTGITAYIGPTGFVADSTEGFRPDVRIWPTKGVTETTVYSRHGDFFAVACSILAILVLIFSFMRRSEAKVT